MEEIAKQFGEELQELLDRYKDHLSTPTIMRIAQPIFKKTIGFRDNPERFKFKGLGYATGFPIIDELNHLQTEQDFKYAWKSEKEVRAMVYKGHCSAQEIAEADCDGDIRHCKDTCGKLRMNKELEGDWVVRDKEPL